MAWLGDLLKLGKLFNFPAGRLPPRDSAAMKPEEKGNELDMCAEMA